MCSISGIIEVGVGASEDCLQRSIRRLNAALVHRGPDDNGSVIEPLNSGFVAIGNTRLAIIDPSSAGHQPMQDPLTGNWLTYNGETYNFSELRAELDGAGELWRSRTDTEVVLHAYRRWGVQAFTRMRGMFALAIWDAERKELLAVRDRFGIKPLYYTVQKHSEGSRLIFASEIRALLASGMVPKKLDPKGLTSYLQCGSVQAPATIIEGVRALLPGHYLRVRLSDKSIAIEEVRYASIGCSSIPELTGARDAVARLRHELESSIRLHLNSDVPLGVFLSGGMDSSALVALLSKVSNKSTSTFSVGFAESQFNEAVHARLVAKKFQTEHHEICLTEAGLLDLLPETLAAMDQPTSDGVNTYIVARAVKNAGVTVALSGLGGDELFAGYPSFRRALRIQSISNLSKRLLRASSGVGRDILGRSVRQNKFWQLAESDGSAAAVYKITRQLFAPDEMTELTGGEGPPNLEENTVPTNGFHDPVNAISRLELEGYMANTLLRDTDTMSMAHALEVRVPFVDQEVAGFLLSLPGGWKLNGNGKRSKPLLAEAVSDLLPPEILRRTKMGFTLPFEKWLQTRLRAEVDDTFRDERKLLQSGIRADVAARIWEKFLVKSRSVGWSRPWSLYVLAKWCEINEVVR